MASINYATREISCKVVYYGPGLSGKTTNIQQIFQRLGASQRGQLVSLATPGEHTLYFDFLPISLEQSDYNIKFAVYSVPGQAMYNATRKLVLRGVDGLVFVADSHWEMMQENVESLQNMEINLAAYDLKLDDLPTIIQYNKRDLPEAAPLWYMDYLLNRRGWPVFEATATTGRGVFDTLQTTCRYVLRDLMHRFETGTI